MAQQDKKAKVIKIFIRSIKVNIKLYNYLYPNLDLTLGDVINHLIKNQKK